MMSTFLIGLFGFIALGLLIFVHETGHFLFAKLFGVRVLTYSFGFGHRLFGVRYKGTDYRVSSFPFGGYVRMWGADPFEVEEHEAQQQAEADTVEQDAPGRPPQRGEWALQDVSVWKRLVIYAAGPAANLVVPFFVFVVLFMAGEPQIAPVVGTVLAGSAAQQAGVLPGDRVVEVGGQPVTTWEEMALRWDEVLLGDDPVELTLERGGAELRVSLPGASDQLADAYDYGIRMDVPTAHVGVVHSGSPAGLAGVRTGALVLAVDGQDVQTWPELRRRLARPAERVEISWRDAEGTHEATLISDESWVPPSVRGLLDHPADRWGLQTATLVVGRFTEGSAAQEAGLVQGAYLLAIDGERVHSWGEVLRGVSRTMFEDGEGLRAEQVAVTTLQEDSAFELLMTPKVEKDTDARGRYRQRPLIGVASLGQWAEPPTVRVYYSLPAAISRAARDSVLLVRYTVEQIGLLVTGEASPKDSLGGPVEIVRQTVDAAKKGWMYYSRMLGMISISVGIFNLLPVPVLDGGHLLFYALEALRGRPVSPLFRERAQIVGVMLLVALMIFVVFNDLDRWFGGG
jgi:regulator of sigma E protease